jgi:hypothetical protein
MGGGAVAPKTKNTLQFETCVTPDQCPANIRMFGWEWYILLVELLPQ